MISIADTRWSEQTVKHLESKTKSCQSRSKTKAEKNLSGNPPEDTDKPIKKIIHIQLDFRLGQFT